MGRRGVRSRCAMRRQSQPSKAESAAAEAGRQRDEAQHQADIAEQRRRAHEITALEAEFALFRFTSPPTDERTIDTLRRLIKLHRQYDQEEKAAQLELVLKATLQMKESEQAADDAEGGETEDLP